MLSYKDTRGNDRRQSIGFGVDGDEVVSIEAVEAHFAVTLDVGRAAEWRTAGDVFAARRQAV